jgi:4-hydroxybenzoate polyprenyltransferase
MTNKPIAVDLDGSLIYSDMLFETLIRMIFRKPWLLLIVPLWLLKGKAHLKLQLAKHPEIDIVNLPYNTDLIEYLKKQNNREIILCTATNFTLAKRIADHLGIFKNVAGSTDTLNLAGKNKADFLCNKYGEKEFSYVGNEWRDIKIWEKSASASVITDNSNLINKITTLCPIEFKNAPPRLNFKVLLKAFRLHQWVKNLLLFVPLATSHQFSNLTLMSTCFMAFIAFGICASATYLINDLSDLDSDRKHWKKRFRPLASGAMSIKSALLIVIFALPLAGIIAWYVNPYFFAALIFYLLITLAYSFLLKRLQTVDILTLAFLYTLRIVAGGLALDINVTFWLLALSMFLFLCLAIVKRISEIIKASELTAEVTKLSGRGYFTSDIQILNSLATSSGTLSILVFAMYLNSNEVIELYRWPQLLWFICPLYAYWVVRILIMSSRGQIDEDPIVFAVKDWRSWLAGLLIFTILIISI